MKTSSHTAIPLEDDSIIKLFLEGLGSSIKNGISSNERDLEERELVYGHNRKEQLIPAGFCELFWDAL